ncbi:hypothetical protein KP509_38G023700 [Ceratopteris richardii]|uniref:Exostosin GT47 domain-containing protein n=1 Tax=Ceratopteris richardii TaxID=49495 RepID=A0A8T2Q2B1_CERRI|nr:hypothetical protein KP509_38G023700 [Ceratopteris richardii]
MPSSLKRIVFIMFVCCSFLVLLLPYSIRHSANDTSTPVRKNLQRHRQSRLHDQEVHQLPHSVNGRAEQLRSEVHLREDSSRKKARRSKDSHCHGKRIFVYNLPGSFNSDLLRYCRYGLASWLNICRDFENDGFGEPLQAQTKSSVLNGSLCLNTTISPNASSLVGSASALGSPSSSPISFNGWYRTGQFMLEVVFHHRLLHYECLTQDPETADAFFLPYYTGIDALRFLYRSAKSKPKERHGSELVKWLQRDAVAKKAWKKLNGRDHFLVMGRTAWDFDGNGEGEWGTGIVHMPEYKNMTTLLVEREPWLSNQYAIPYPTSFHPSSESELTKWIRKVRSEARTKLFTFVGSVRPKLMKNGIRDALMEQCSLSRNCELLDCKRLRCSHNPQPIIDTFLHSQFCLQPRGDSPTRRSLFDSIIAGCIPVLFHNDTAYSQYKWHLPAETQHWSVYINEDEIRGGAQVEAFLLQYTQETIEKMRDAVIDMIPRTLYAGFSATEESHLDAVDVSVRELLRLVSRNKRRWHKKSLSTRAVSIDT